MSEKDFVIQSTTVVPFGSMITQKPSYLVKFLPEGKKEAKLFLTIEQPKFEISFIQVKGFFIDSDEETIYKSYNEIVAAADKSTYVEMWFPWHILHSVRSLVFKGDKSKK